MKLGRFLLLLAGLALCGALGLAFLNYAVLPRIIHRHAAVRVPDLRGLPDAEARAMAAAAGLRLEVVRQESHPVAPPGQVIDQRPAPGRSIREGRPLAVVASSGPPAGSVPAVAGLSERQAVATLQREEYRLGRVLRVRRAGVAAPAVAWQCPAAGEHLRKGLPVDLVLAEPPPPAALRMPDLRGRSLFVVRDLVARAGCVTAPVRYRRDRGLAPNTIIDQEPPPGARILIGETVELVASTR